MGNSGSKSALPPLESARAGCDTEKFMGTWFVIAVKPTMFEKTNSNAVEKYTWVSQNDTKSRFDIDIDFQYNTNEPLISPMKVLKQKGYIQGDDKSDSSLWKISPFWPVTVPYLILEVDEDNYAYTIIGHPSREYAWIMARHPQLEEETYNMLVDTLKTKHAYNLDGLRKVPQVWTADERTKRGLTQQEIPDDMLEKQPDSSEPEPTVESK